MASHEVACLVWELRFVLLLAVGQLRVGELLSRALRPSYCLGGGCPLFNLFIIYTLFVSGVTVSFYDGLSPSLLFY